jgi:hypothetical protein
MLILYDPGESVEAGNYQKPPKSCVSKSGYSIEIDEQLTGEQ